jgi:predicted nucleic acid-binding protein
MATYLLDTNHASALIDPDHQLWERIRAAVAVGHFLLPADVLEEVQFGVAAIRDPLLRERRQQRLDAVLASFPDLPLSRGAALESGRLRGRLRREGRQMGAVDGHLAALANVNALLLLTDDADFAPLSSEVRIEKWLR